jgi:hypothetical protein
MKSSVLLLLLALASTASARIGDSHEQLIDRYGEPKTDPATKMMIQILPLLSGSTQYVFIYQGWRIQTALAPAKDGKRYVVRQSYQRVDGRAMTDYEVKAILDAESAGAQWKPQQAEKTLNIANAATSAFESSLFRRWTRTDGATAETMSPALILKLELPQARAYEQELKRIQEHKRRESVPQF